jgi:hypothetical protein
MLQLLIAREAFHLAFAAFRDEIAGRKAEAQPLTRGSTLGAKRLCVLAGRTPIVGTS